MTSDKASSLPAGFCSGSSGMPIARRISLLWKLAAVNHTRSGALPGPALRSKCATQVTGVLPSAVLSGYIPPVHTHPARVRLAATALYLYAVMFDPFALLPFVA